MSNLMEPTMLAMLTDYVSTYGINAVTYPVGAFFAVLSAVTIWRGV